MNSILTEYIDLSLIYDTLRHLGISEHYTGFFYVSYATYLAVLHPDSLLLVSKRLYPAVASHFHTSWKRVERNIRTIIDIAWITNPSLLMDLAPSLT